MTREEALKILDAATGQVSLPRKDHVLILQALEVLKKESAPVTEQKERKKELLTE